jgi:hypothetical protein
MAKLPLLSAFFVLTTSVFAGVTTCTGNTYSVFPIPGVTGGSATSCGNANVTTNSVFAATPGSGSVDFDVLAAYLNNNLSGSFDAEFFVPGEGSAVMLSGFSAPSGATLSFNWAGSFEPNATGALFYIFNGVPQILDARYPPTEPCVGLKCINIIEPCDAVCQLDVPTNQVTLSLADGPNTLSFGAIVLTGRLVPSVSLDPSLTVNNFAVTASNIPEPATLGLTGAVLLGLAAWRRRRAQ